MLFRYVLVWRRHHYHWMGTNFDQYSALMAIKQWGFLSLPHLMWRGISVYNGHLRGPVTPTPFCSAFSSGAVTICFNEVFLSRSGFEHPIFRMRGERSTWLRHRRSFILQNLWSNYNESWHKSYLGKVCSNEGHIPFTSW